MKKIFPFIALSTFGLLAWGQSEKHELFFTSGIGSGPFIVESLNHLGIDLSGWLPPELRSNETHKDHILPVITLGYQYRLSKKFKLGSEMIFDRFWIDNRKNSYHFNSLFVRCDFIWYESRKLLAHSAVSIGATNKRSIETIDGNIRKRNEILPGMHLYLIGIDFKLGKFSITANNGIGMSGVVNLGVKYRF